MRPLAPAVGGSVVSVAPGVVAGAATGAAEEEVGALGAAGATGATPPSPEGAMDGMSEGN